MTMGRHHISIVLLATLLGTSCSNKKSNSNSEKPTTEQAKESQKTGTTIVQSKVEPESITDDNTIVIDPNNFIQLTEANGMLYLPVEGTFTEQDFKGLWIEANSKAVTPTEAIQNMSRELESVFKDLKAENVEFTAIKTYPKYGYFTGYLTLPQYERLSQITPALVGNMMIDPIVSTKNIADLDDFNKEVMQNIYNDNRDTLEGFSGLRPMGVVKFLDMMKSELKGVQPTGSNVIVGVTDTGVSYNHPAFLDADGNTRITRMRDFTLEGKIYFDKDANFSVSIPSTPLGDAEGYETLLLTADYYQITTKTRETPIAKEFATIKDTHVKLTDKLAAKLKVPGHGIKLGAISERSYASRIDLNFNGKTDDDFFTLLVPRGEDYEIYLSASITKDSNEIDFRNSIPIGDFNKTKDTMPLVAEKFGFDIRETTLQNAKQENLEVMSASIVGFDTAGHGSHVTGIIGARKYIQNDSDDTLARGVVPDAELRVNRICAIQGGCYNWPSAIIDLAESGAEVINMSIGGLSPGNDEYGIGQLLIDRLTIMEDVLFMISAGNSGAARNTVGTPSTAKYALSIGATATNRIIERQYLWPSTGRLGSSTLIDPEADFVMNFSSRGPSASGGFSPDLVAPGTELSAYPLHRTSGAGLNTIWGTSMASPAAAGAAALLIDAAKIYNKQNPNNLLPIDALTIKRVLLESARPFDATVYDPDRRLNEIGQYTWIDQGAGMINLPGAWKTLKEARDSKLPSVVSYSNESGNRVDVHLDYTIEVANKAPNGLDYTGTEDIDPDNPSAGKKLGQGLWFDFNSDRSYYRVTVDRQLPETVALAKNFGDLHRQLVTSRDEFQLQTTMYGSNVDWLKVGVNQQTNCVAALATNKLSIIGTGDLADGRLGLCIDKAKLKSLPPGDHGALIRAYRMDGNDNKESFASFIIPVYVSIPEKVLLGSSSYEVSGTVQSFATKRHYIEIPEGTKLLTLTLDVPEARINEEGNIVDCSGIRLSVHESGNSVTSPELAQKSYVSSCFTAGGLTPNENRTLTFTRENPNPGIWDLMVFGYYTMPESQYSLRVDFAKLDTSLTSITGGFTDAKGEFTAIVEDSSFENAVLTDTKSKYIINSLQYTQEHSITHKEEYVVKAANGVDVHAYDSGVSKVVVATNGAPKSDIDLRVFSCDANGDGCKELGSSTSSNDEEEVSFNPKANTTYKIVVEGYNVAEEGDKFNFLETITNADFPAGKLVIESPEKDSFIVKYDGTHSDIFHHPDFVSGEAKVVGEIDLRTETNSLMRIPVTFSK